MINKLDTYCGNIIIIGKTNVGKSTLFNNLIGKKISIISKKKNTTRNKIVGINTENNYQSIYIDTPGFYFKTNHIEKKKELKNLFFNSFFKNIHIIFFVIDSLKWTLDDERILNKLYSLNFPIILVINKIDIIKKSFLLPFINFINKKKKFSEIIPISAKKSVNIFSLIKVVKKKLPKNTHYFPKNYVTNSSKNFILSEIIREKLIYFLYDELPYLFTIEVKQIKINDLGIYNIISFILVNRDSQKKIVIGKNGEKIKNISMQSRIGMEIFLESKVHLKIWVKKNKFTKKNKNL